MSSKKIRVHFLIEPELDEKIRALIPSKYPDITSLYKDAVRGLLNQEQVTSPRVPQFAELPPMTATRLPNEIKLNIFK